MKIVYKALLNIYILLILFNSVLIAYPCFCISKKNIKFDEDIDQIIEKLKNTSSISNKLQYLHVILQLHPKKKCIRQISDPKYWENTAVDLDVFMVFRDLVCRCKHLTKDPDFTIGISKFHFNREMTSTEFENYGSYAYFEKYPHRDNIVGLYLNEIIISVWDWNICLCINKTWKDNLKKIVLCGALNRRPFGALHRILTSDITELDISGREVAEYDYGLVSYIASLQDLKRLHMQRVKLFREVWKMLLCSMPKNIEYLDFSNSNYQGVLVDNIANCTELKGIDLSYCIFDDPKNWDELLENLPISIEVINLDHSNWNGNGMIYLSKFCNLREIYLPADFNLDQIVLDCTNRFLSPEKIE